MYRLLPLLLLAQTLLAQTSLLDKAPQDIDDALRGRIKQFYDNHVSRKYRLCEELIAEESKDDFYVMTKAQLDGYKIGNIEYSDHFTKAKAVIVGMMPMLLPGVGPKVMEQPFASFWKSDNGVWFWYYNKGAAKENAAGQSKSIALGEPGSLGQPPDAAIALLQSAVKIDRAQLELTGNKPQTIKVTNTLPGPVTLSVQCPLGSLSDTGIKATFDKPDLKKNESAILTLVADPKKHSGPVPLQILVSPTNQVLNLSLTITH